MATFSILNRSPDGSTYYSEMGMGEWKFGPIVDMVQGFFNGTFVEKDYILVQMAPVAGFPQLFFKLSGDFNFVTGETSNGPGPFVQAGSIINQIDVVDASGKIYSEMTGVSFAFNADKTSTAYEDVDLFLTSFNFGEIPFAADLMAGNDLLTGNVGTEYLMGFGGNDTLNGYGGSDALFGGDGHDRLVGGTEADDLYGEAGNDTIVGYTAGDYVDGGEGFDTFALQGTYSTGIGLSPRHDYTGVSFYGIEAISISFGEIVLSSYQVGNASAVQTIIGGTNYRDALRIVAPDGANVNLSNVVFQNWNNTSGELDRVSIVGHNGADLITASMVNDRIDAGAGANWVNGGAGNDYLNAADQNDTLIGGAGNDTLLGWGGNDRLTGGGGDDAINGGAGTDTAVFAGTVQVKVNLATLVAQNTGYGSDVLTDIENIESGTGADLLRGSAVANRLWAEAGNDTVFGGDGNDTIYGLAGNDILIGDAGNDYLSAGPGVDTAVFIGAVATTVNLGISVAQNTGYGMDVLLGFENVISGSGADRLSGNSAANTLAGGDGNDTLAGSSGNDALLGGNGNDLLTGGVGDDRTQGGAGSDRFVLNTGAGADTFVDFQNGIDRIQITNGADLFSQITVQDSGANAVIRFSDVTVTLLNFDHLLVDVSDFIFL